MSVYLSINLNVTRTGVQKTLSGVSVGENEKDLLISLSKGDEVYKPPVGSMAILYVEKPDGTHGMFKCNVTNGCVIAPVRPQMTSVAGNVRCQVEIVTALQSVLYCPEFILEVAATVQNNTELVIESDDDYQDIDAILEAANAFWEKGGVRVVDELPEEAVENTIAYLLGDGLYRYADDEWIQLTDDGTIATVAVLSAVSHTHANKTVLDAITAEKVAGWDTAAENEHTHSNADVLDTITAAMVNNSHGHSNKSVLDKLSVSGIGLYYDGRMVGIPVLTSGLPNNFPDGTIIFYYGTGNGISNGIWQCRQYENRTAWTLLLRLNLGGDVEALRQDSHTHTNKALLDLITEAMVNNSHSHSNKDVLDTITAAMVNNSHGHSNKGILDNITQEEINHLATAYNAMHSHSNDDVLEKFSEVDGTPLYDGEEIVGAGVSLVDTAHDLPNDATDGDVALACFDDFVRHLTWVDQVSDEEVEIDISDVDFRIFTPKYDAAAIAAAIAAQDISASATLHLELLDNKEGEIVFKIIPVFTDAEDNEFVSAGITIGEDDDFIVATETPTKKYAIMAEFTGTGINTIRKDEINDVDEDYESVPAAAVYVFEDLEDEDGYAYCEGWNVLRVTIDKATHSDVIDTAFDGFASDINDIINFTVDEDNTLTLEGTKASVLFDGVFDVKNDMQPKGLYVMDDAWQRAGDVQDYTPLTFKPYNDLVIRDLVRSDSIQDVPVYNAEDHISSYSGYGGYSICALMDVDENAISLEETYDANGDPVRFIAVCLDGTTYVWLPKEISRNGSTVPAGWSSEGQTCEAPSLAGFTPVILDKSGCWYEDLTNIPSEARLALGSLSQCINESAAAMGHINIPEDAVVRYTGKIEANKKYMWDTYSGGYLNLPNVPCSKTDAQFVIYLNCTSNIVDLSFPENTRIVGDIDTSQGKHKIIGCWLKDISAWAVGSVTYDEQEVSS